MCRRTEEEVGFVRDYPDRWKEIIIKLIMIEVKQGFVWDYPREDAGV